MFVFYVVWLQIYDYLQKDIVVKREKGDVYEIQQ